MLPIHIALVSQTSRVGLPSLMQASAALQKQVVRDFGPIWGIKATVDAFASLSQVPVGYQPVIIKDNIGIPGAAGIHLDKNGQPYALVQFSADWVLTTSHEILEMLGDPTGNRVVAGQSPKPGQGRVEFLVEVCDPSEDRSFGYQINGLLVSDFYTPHYFDPVASSGVRYSFTNAIKKPRQVLRGGYLSWRDPVTNKWWQETWFGTTTSTFRQLSMSGSGSLRSQVDASTPTDVTIPKPLTKASAAKLAYVASDDGLELGNCSKSSAHDASTLETEIAEMLSSFGIN